MTVWGTIPARFLTITAHAIITISMLWSRNANIMSCLPLQHNFEQYDEKDTQYIVALSMTLVCCAIEYFGFFGGMSTFMPLVCLISIACHTAGCATSAFFVWDVWECDLYWYIFVICSAIPALVEMAAIVRVLVTKRL